MPNNTIQQTDANLKNSLEYRLKVICILQNAWGDRTLPLIFAPNPLNKSAKTIQNKILKPYDIMHFCNTTGEVTGTAKERAKTDHIHFVKVLKRLRKYDVVLVCGRQAEAAVIQYYKPDGPGAILLEKALLIMPHPASRSLSNATLANIRNQVENIRFCRSIGSPVWGRFKAE